MLPDIKVSLPILFLLWCGLALWGFGGPVLLAYPVIWLAVAGLFFAASKLVGAEKAAE